MSGVTVLSSVPARCAFALPAHSVAVVIGTRPEAVKMSEVVRRLGPAALLVHTGQHYSSELREQVSSDVGLPAPDVELSVGGKSRAAQIGEAVAALGSVFRDHPRVEAVAVHGDTNATLAGALAANAEGLRLFHVEAGLRSGDRRMPEEHNRVVVDHLSDVCFAPTESARANLLGEGIPESRIELTGNTIVEVVRRLVPGTQHRSRICDRFGVTPDAFVLATLHRPENTDDPAQVGAVLAGLRSLDAPVLMPMHPRTRALAPARWFDGIRVVDSLAPRDFLALMAEAALIVTDSGGIQEEVTVLRRPALVVRSSTERPESLGAWCELVQPGPDFRELARRRMAARGGLPFVSPYGDGSASERIVSIVASQHAQPLLEAA